MPLNLAVSLSKYSADTASEGYKTTAPGIFKNMGISSKPICEGPSCPMLMPEWEPVNLILEKEYCAILIKSCALLKKAENVATNGFSPMAENPTAMPTIFCSAINDWKDLLGNLSKKYSVMVEFLTSPSTTTASLLIFP